MWGPRSNVNTRKKEQRKKNYYKNSRHNVPAATLMDSACKSLGQIYSAVVGINDTLKYVWVWKKLFLKTYKLLKNQPLL